MLSDDFSGFGSSLFLLLAVWQGYRQGGSQTIVKYIKWIKRNM